MKQASISNTINTYTTICSTDALLKEAEQTFKRRAIRNGYDSGYVDRVKQRKKTTQKPKESFPTLTIPYVSSAFTNDIKIAVKRSNLKVRKLQRAQSCLKTSLSSQDPTANHAKMCPSALFATTHLLPCRALRRTPSECTAWEQMSCGK